MLSKRCVNPIAIIIIIIIIIKLERKRAALRIHRNGFPIRYGLKVPCSY